MKNSEVRDLLLGKLFSYLVLVRSELLQEDDTCAVKIFEKLLELHTKKYWLKEVTNEALLLTMTKLKPSLVEKECLPLLKEGKYAEHFALSTTPFNQYGSWQLHFAIGLQRYGQMCEDVKKSIRKIIPKKNMTSSECLEEMRETLLDGSKGWPRIHKMWEFILGQIFGMSDDFALPNVRVESLSSKQMTLLLFVLDFIQKTLIYSTHDRRALAFDLTVKIATVVPLPLLHLCVSQSVVKAFVSCRTNKKHTLYQVAGRALQNLMVAIDDKTEDDKESRTESKVLLASLLVSHGGANFDTITGVVCVGSLLADLQEADVFRHIESLCRIIVSSTVPEDLVETAKNSNAVESNNGKEKNGEVKSKGKKAKDDNDDMEEDQKSGDDQDNEGEDSNLDIPVESAACMAIEALAALLKNTSLSCRGSISSTVLVILIRLGCFGKKLTDNNNKKGKSKSKGHKNDKNSSSDLISTAAQKCLSIVDGVLEDGTKMDLNYPAVVIETSANKLLNILAGVGSFTITQLDHSGDNENGENVTMSPFNDEPSLLETALTIVRWMTDQGVPLILKSSVAVNPSMDFNAISTTASASVKSNEDDLEVREEVMSTLVTTFEAVDAMKTINSRLKDALVQLICQSVFHTIASTTDLVSTLAELNDFSTTFLESQFLFVLKNRHQDTNKSGNEDSKEDGENTSKKNGKKKKQKAEDADAYGERKSEEVDEEHLEQLGEHLGSLLDTSLDLISLSGDTNVKGLRDSVKKIWGVIGKDLPPSMELLDTAVAAVVGEDVEDEDEDEEDEDEEEHDEDANTQDKDADADDKKSRRSTRKRGDSVISEASTDSNVRRSSRKRGDSVVSEASIASTGSARSKGKKQIKKGEEEALTQEEEEEAEEEDIMLSGDSVMDMLAMDGASDDEEELEALKGMVTEHGTEADLALANMLAMRRQSRKSGLTEAKRKQMTMRSRALDILESLVHRLEAPELLLRLFHPLLTCIRKIQSGLTQSLQEGRTFETRLRQFMEQRVSKKKFRLKHFGDSETEEGIKETLDILIEPLMADYGSTAIQLRRLSHNCLLCLTRASLGGDSESVKDKVGDYTNSLLKPYFEKKNSRINSSLFEELIARFPDFSMKYLYPTILRGAKEGKSNFLKIDACRLASLFYKRVSNLDESSKKLLDKYSVSTFDAFSTILTVLQENGGEVAKNGNTEPSSSILKSSKEVVKKVKPILQVIREFATLCKGNGKALQELSLAHITSNGTTKRKRDQVDGNIDISFEDAIDNIVSQVSKETNSANSGIQSVAKQTLLSLRNIFPSSTPATATGEDKGKKDKKAKKGSTLEEQEEGRLIPKNKREEEDAGEQKQKKVKKANGTWSKLKDE
jgi:hypothetical protein